jgi:hypothetical protein
MKEWLINLKENKNIESISLELSQSGIQIFSIEEKWFIKLININKLSQPYEIYLLATNFVNKINNVFFYLNNHIIIEMENIAFLDENDSLHFFDFFFTEIKIDVGIESSISNSPVKLDSVDPISNLLNIANNQTNVADALHYFRKNDWNNLYKVYEIIRDDVKDIPKQNFVGITKKKLDKFTQTAQASNILGDQARHASRKFFLFTGSMGFQEANIFIKTLLGAWLSTKQS